MHMPQNQRLNCLPDQRADHQRPVGPAVHRHRYRGARGQRDRQQSHPEQSLEPEILLQQGGVCRGDGAQEDMQHHDLQDERDPRVVEDMLRHGLGDEKTRLATPMPNATLTQNATLAASGMSCWRWMSALPMPASQKTCEKLMTIVAAAMTPKSSGVSRRARIRNTSGWMSRDASSLAADHLNATNSGWRNRCIIQACCQSDSHRHPIGSWIRWPITPRTTPL